MWNLTRPAAIVATATLVLTGLPVPAGAGTSSSVARVVPAVVTAATASTVTVSLRKSWRVTSPSRLRIKDGPLTCRVVGLVPRPPRAATQARIRCAFPASVTTPVRIVVSVSGIRGAVVRVTVPVPAGGGSAGSGGTGGSGGSAGGSTSTGPTTSAGAIVRVNADAAGRGGNAEAGSATWSPDGSRVAFISAATNLVPGVADGCPHVYVKTLATGAISAVDRDASGNLGDCLESTHSGLAFSPDGSWLLFCASSNSLMPNVHPWARLFGKNLQTGRVEWFGPECSHPVWTGNRIAFAATGPWPCDDGNGFWDILVIETSSTLGYCSDFVVASSASDGTVASGGSSLRPQLSPRADKVVFESESPTLVPGDTNGSSDVFVKDLTSGQITRVSTGTGGAQGSGGSEIASWSPDGTWVLFQSGANDLVAGDINVGVDIFVKNVSTGLLALVSTKSDDSPSIKDHYVAGWAPDGIRIAWTSLASDLVPNDTNGLRDVFVKDLKTGRVQLVSSNASGVQGESNSSTYESAPGIWSPDATRVLFTSNARNLAPGDGNEYGEDIFVKRVG
ncbi:MAG: hypothetical protein R2737_06620 [Candidatus Nanopelagicales bacterium]